jgi:hypothetical protein
MAKGVLAITAAIVILTVGTASGFWDVVLFGHRIIETPTIAPPRPTAKERPTARVAGSIKAIDREDGAVTLVAAPGGTLTLAVQDWQTLDAIRVGDPVVATYYEALVIQVRLAGAVTPEVSAPRAVVASKPRGIVAGPVENSRARPR